MTKGERIEMAILDELARFCFTEWLADQEIDENDYATFMEAGAKALPEEEEEH